MHIDVNVVVQVTMNYNVIRYVHSYQLAIDLSNVDHFSHMYKAINITAIISYQDHN